MADQRQIFSVVGVALIVGAVWIVYGRALNAPFVFDDSESVNDNRSIVSLWPLIGNAQRPGPLNPPKETTTSGRPLVNLSLAVNYYFGQLNPVGYHLFNLIVHVLSALLVMAIVQRALCLEYFEGKFASASRPLSLAVALLWALHPLQTETVVYVTQRTELMVGFFYLATMYASIRYWASASTADRNTWLALAIVACLAGVACKEVMVTAPVIVLLFERTFIAGSFRGALRKSWPLYVGLFLSWGLLLILNHSAPRSDSAGFHLEVPAYAWWLTQTKVLLMYLKLAVWPWPLSIHYEMPYLTAAGAWPYVAGFALLGISTLILLWRRSAIGFVGAWVFIILSPTLIVPIVTEVAAERRMYLPLAALVTLVVAAAYRLAQQLPLASRWALALASTVAVLLATVCGVVSAERLAAYQSELTLWQDNVEHQPNDPISYNNLGLSLARMGQLPEAVQQFEKTLQLHPDHASAHSNLSCFLAQLGRTQEAIEHGQKAIAINPNAPDAHNNLGNGLARAGRSPEAIEQYKEALRLKADYPDAHNNMGYLLAAAGQFEEAIFQYEEALRLNPNYALAHGNLANTYLNVGRPDKAIEHLQEVIRLRPKDVNANVSLGIALAQTGRRDEAIAMFQTALRMNPIHPRAHNNLGLALAKENKLPEAIDHYRQAIEAQPDYTDAYANLAEAYARVQQPAAAIAAAEKGLELARSQGHTALADRLESSLKSYRSTTQSTSTAP